MFTKNLDDMIYSSWDTVCQVEIGKYGSFFAHLPASKNQKKKKKKYNFEKMEKIAGDIILHMCTKNCNHVRYGS